MKLLSVLPGFALHQIRSVFYGSKGILLQEGARAPEFSIRDETGTEHRLSQYFGKQIVLWWFVRASTPG